uniref:cupin domain-containing protein n=1 Tax=Xanthomonas axonopodis TaxID=53413 RepID=UPI003D76BD8E
MPANNPARMVGPAPPRPIPSSPTPRTWLSCCASACWHKGAGIGLHLHDKDEIYSIVSGRGLYALDGKQYQVAAGDALLTRPGSTHALQQTGEEPLVLLLAYTASK